jgi:hypothetical protein
VFYPNIKFFNRFHPIGITNDAEVLIRVTGKVCYILYSVLEVNPSTWVTLVTFNPA